uniref:Uncharacterized protein n=1 Tax=Panagrolaimus superbus TaxID=310955 RepID=A0A914YK03_9BILA
MVYAARLQGDAACGGDGAALAIQLPGAQQQALSAGMAERALHVGHVAGVDLQRRTIAGQHAVAVVEQTRYLKLGRGAACRTECAATVGELAGFDVLGTVAGNGARVVGQAAAYLQCQRPAAGCAQRACAVVQAVGHDIELPGRHAAAAEIQ